MIVLGIDPGVASTGFGVVSSQGGKFKALDGGVIATTPEHPVSERLVEIHRRVSELIDTYRPDTVAVEDIFFSSNVETAFAVGRASGVVLLAAGQAAKNTYTYTPQAVKKSVCGSGSADKSQVQRMVKSLLSLERIPRPDHASDALAVAICQCNRAGMLNACEKVGVKVEVGR